MSRKRDLMYKLRFLRLQLEIAQENGYDLMQPRIKSEISRVEGELAEGGGCEAPHDESGRIEAPAHTLENDPRGLSGHDGVA
jgi:hypothetical protein